MSEYDTIDKLIGLSLGGMLALNDALDYPHKIKELIIAAGQIKIPSQLMKVQIALFLLMPNRVFKTIPISKESTIQLMASTLTLDMTDQLPHFHGRVKIIIWSHDWLIEKLPNKWRSYYLRLN